eukprot:s1396_g23.t1
MSFPIALETPSFTAAEQRQLDLLLAKREQAKKSAGAAAKSSMTDASKRRRTSEDDDPSSFDEGEWISEQITAMQAGEIAKGEVMVPHHLDEMIPTPKGLSFEDWCETLVTMPKYKKEKISFSELYSKAAVEAECRKYCSWILKTYGTDDNLQTKTEQGALQVVHQPYSQAIDLAAFLKATKFASQVCGESEGYRREFK